MRAKRVLSGPSLPSDEFVEQLPSRVAQATFAVIVASEDLKCPVRLNEVFHRDELSLSAASTKGALARAREWGLVHNARHVWMPSFKALNLRTLLEDRVLAEWERAA